MASTRSGAEVANPAGNALQEGAGHDALLEAVTRSGYPLETVIAARLDQRGFRIEEEWPYTDSDSGDERTLDLEAARVLSELQATDRGRIGVALNLLIECKVSELPYVAFESVKPPSSTEYPMLAGAPRRRIDLYKEASTGKYRPTPIQTILGLETETFSCAPPVASSLSRAARKGRDLMLSGEQPYKALAFPLAKALDFSSLRFAAAKNQRDWWWVHVVFAVAVIDAPLAIARAPGETPTLEMSPWIRLLRRHATDPTDPWDRVRELSMIEVVHRDFFDSFLDDYLLPFAERISEKIMSLQDILIAGRAVAPELDFAKGGAPEVGGIKPYDR